MALGPVGAKAIIYGVKDRDGNTAHVTLFAPNAVVTENVQDWALGDGLALVVAITDGVVFSMSINQSFSDPVAAQPPETSDVERKAKFSFNVEGGGVSTFRIPSVKNSLVVDGTNALNPADAAVTNFIAAMVDTGLFDTVGMGNFRGDKLISLNGIAEKTHIRNPKG